MQVRVDLVEEIGIQIVRDKDEDGTEEQQAEALVIPDEAGQGNGLFLRGGILRGLLITQAEHFTLRPDVEGQIEQDEQHAAERDDGIGVIGDQNAGQLTEDHEAEGADAAREGEIEPRAVFFKIDAHHHIDRVDRYTDCDVQDESGGIEERSPLTVAELQCEQRDQLQRVERQIDPERRDTRMLITEGAQHGRQNGAERGTGRDDEAVIGGGIAEGLQIAARELEVDDTAHPIARGDEGIEQGDIFLFHKRLERRRWEMMKQVKVVAAVICDDTRNVKSVYATRRGYGEQKGMWEFPGGKIEPGETPENALIREIREELTVEIRVGERLGVIEYDYPAFHLSMDCFLCEVTKGQLTLLEAEDAAWLTKETLFSVDWLPADRVILPALEEKMAR